MVSLISASEITCSTGVICVKIMIFTFTKFILQTRFEKKDSSYDKQKYIFFYKKQQYITNSNV